MRNSRFFVASPSVILEVKRLKASSFTPSLKQLHPGDGWKFFGKKTGMIQKQLGTKNNAQLCNLYVAEKKCWP